MEDNSSNIQRGNERTHHYYAINGKLMLISLVVLVAFCIIIAFFHSYARWLRRRNRELPPNDYVPRHRAPPSETNRNTRKGLERSVVKSLPTFLFDSAANSLPQECAVCLSEFGDGELCRFLPNCSHCFHVNCIDTWFRSHSNCPLCRSPVEPIAPLTRISASEAGSSSRGSYSTSHSDEDQLGRSSSCVDRIKISESVSIAVEIPVTNRPDSGDPTRRV